MGLSDRDLKVENIYIYGFGGESIRVKGTIRLPVTLGDGAKSATQIVDFMAVDQESSHNALIGRPLLKEMRVVTSIYHLSMKFPTPGGVGCVRGCQYDSRECYNRSVKGFKKNQGMDVNGVRMDVNTLYLVEFPEDEELKVGNIAECTYESAAELVNAQDDAEYVPEQKAELVNESDISDVLDLQRLQVNKYRRIGKGKAVRELYPIIELNESNASDKEDLRGETDLEK